MKDTVGFEGNHTYSPCHDLIQSVLAIPLLDLPHRIDQLILMEIYNFPAFIQVPPDAQQFCQIQHGAGEEDSVLVLEWNHLREVQSGCSGSPVPFFGRKCKKIEL